MIPFSVLFDGKWEMEYKGKNIFKSFRFYQKGDFLFKFEYVESNSHLDQAITLHFIDFNGKIFLNGEETKTKNKRFPQINMWEGENKSSFELRLIIDEGFVALANSTQVSEGSIYYDSLVFGCAMFYEMLSENKYRFYCNDRDNDDDFDDLIFDLEITKVGNSNE